VSIGTAFTHMFSCPVPMQQAGWADSPPRPGHRRPAGWRTRHAHRHHRTRSPVVTAGCHTGGMPVGVSFLLPFLDRLAL